MEQNGQNKDSQNYGVDIAMVKIKWIKLRWLKLAVKVEQLRLHGLGCVLKTEKRRFGNFDILGVVYFNQLSGAAHTQKLVETFFRRFLLISTVKSLKSFEMNKKG